jgi:hypothetical protein
MDRQAAVNELSPLYASAIRLWEAGAGVSTVASALGVEKEAIFPLLAVAEAKVRAHMERAATEKGGVDG